MIWDKICNFFEGLVMLLTGLVILGFWAFFVWALFQPWVWEFLVAVVVLCIAYSVGKDI